MIFDSLAIGQLAECYRVCKKWQSTIDCLMSFDCLVVYRDCLPVNQTLFSIHQRVSLRHCIHLDAFTEREEFKKSIYRKFQRICLYDHHFENFRYTDFNHYMIRPRTDFPLRMLSYLQQLEELHLWSLYLDNSYRLSLPNLKTFKTIHSMPEIALSELAFHDHEQVELDTPQLSNLSLTDIRCVKLVHPETIESLEIRGSLTFNVVSDFPMFLESLTGLKCLLIEGRGDQVCCYITQNELVEILKGRLRELHVLLWSNGRSDYEFELSREACQTMSELKEQANQMRIYFNGLEMNCLRHLLDESSRKERNNFFFKNGLVRRDQRDLYLTNCSALSKTLPFHLVNYDLIEELNGSALDFFSAGRMPRLEAVVVSKPVKNELAFGSWLSKSNSLPGIIFERPLSQEFYSNILPASCPTLEGLILLFNPPPDFSLDFSFLLKLKSLYRIDLTSSDYGLVELLFSNLAYLRYLAFYEFKRENKRPKRPSLGIVKRIKEKQTTYEVCDGQMGYLYLSYPEKEFESLERLIEFAKLFTGF